MSSRSLALVVLLLASACSKVAPTNPFDPEAPKEVQAKARVRGALSAETRASAEGLAVELRLNGSVVQQTSTAADGGFVFDGLSPARYVLSSAPEGFVPLSLPLDLRAGDDLNVGALVLSVSQGAEHATLTGVVTLAGEEDHSGTLVEAVGRAFTAVTDSSGSWRLQLAAGTYTLRFTHKNYVTNSLEEIVVVAREERSLDALTLPANPATVTGLVEAEQADGTIEPLDQALVTADGTGVTGLTNATGAFALTGLPAGGYLIRVVKQGHVPVTVPVLGIEGGETRALTENVRLALSRGALHGVVSLADTGDASGITVEATGSGRAAVTDSSGRFALDGLLVGAYELAARKDGYARRVLGTFTVVEGQRVDAGTHALARQSGALTVTQGGWTRQREVTLQLSSPGATGFRASEDPTFENPALGDTDGDDWRPYTASASHPFLLSDRDGEHEIWVVFHDGNTSSAPASARTVLDRQAPTAATVVIESGGGYTNAQTGIVTVTLGAQDLPATPEATVSGLARVHLADTEAFENARTLDFTRSTTWTLADASQDGAKEVWAKFEDAAGNVGAPVHAVVVLDRVAPSAPSISLSAAAPANPGYALQPVVTAHLSATDANGGEQNASLLVRLSHDPGFGPARFNPFEASTTWLLSPGDGEKTVYAQFLDPAGNLSLPVHASIVLDGHGPTQPAVRIHETDGIADDSLVRTSTVTVELSAGDAPVSAQLSESPAFTDAKTVTMTGLPQPVSTSFTFSGAGTRTLWARFFDAAGNSSALATAPVVIDDAAPLALPASLYPTGYTRVATVQLIAPSAGQAKLSLTGDVLSPAGVVDAAPGASIAVTLTAGDGLKTIIPTWHDAAGNQTLAPQASIILDAQAPSSTALVLTGALADGGPSTTLTAARDVTVTLPATDATSGVARMKLSNRSDLSDASWQPFPSSATAGWTLSAGDGTRTVYAQFEDFAGNVSGVAQGTITVSAAPPGGGSVLLAGGASRTSNRNLTVSIAATGATQMALSLDGFATAPVWLPYATTRQIDLGTNDERTVVVSVRFRNAARVEGGSASSSIYFDATPPTAGALSLVGSLGNGQTSTTVTATPAIVAKLTAPSADVSQVALVQAANCAGAFSAPSWQPFSSAVSFVLSGADGAKRVCAIFRDETGNFDPSAVASHDLVLDTTAPTNPAFTNVASTVTNEAMVPANGLATITASTDALSTVTYECTGGQYGSSWASCGTTASLPAFVLAQNRENTLGVRARDAAFNVSPGALVRVVHDTLPPLPPNIATVQTTQNTVSVAWTPSPSADVVSYRLNYGTSPGEITGTGADQGPSPVGAGSSTSAQLSGLSTGSVYTVSVVAVDQAGNESDPSGERTAVPNVVNPRVVASVGGVLRSAGRGSTGETYVSQNLGLVRVEGASVTGRATLPNFVPSSRSELQIVPCKHDGTMGQCVFVTGSTMEGDYRGDDERYKAGVAVVFFPPGNVSAPTVGRQVTTLSAPAERLHLSGDGKLLYALDARELRVFSIADPTRPTLVTRAAFPGDVTVRVGGSGLSDKRLWVLGRSPDVNEPLLWSFDLSSDSLETKSYVTPKGEGGEGVVGDQLDPTLVVTEKLVALAYGRSPYRVCPYDPSGAAYPLPSGACVSLTNARREDNATSACGVGEHLYLFGKTDDTDEPRIFQVKAAGSGLTEGSAIVTARLQNFCAASASSTTDHLLAVEGYDAWAGGGHQTAAWNITATTATHASTYVEPSGSLVAHLQGMLVVSNGRQLHSLDVSNPMLPRLVDTETSTRTGSWKYIALVAHGHYAYALADGATGGLDIFRLNGDGTLTRTRTCTYADGVTLAVSGRQAYIGRGYAGTGVQAFDLTSCEPDFGGTLNVSALDVRGQTIYAANENGDFQTLSHVGESINVLSSLVLNPTPSPGFNPPRVVRHLRVAGTLAAVSSASETFLVDVETPASPYFTGRTFPLGGPVVMQGGYLVGSSPVLSYDHSPGSTPEAGPRFTVQYGGQVDGTIPFATCGADGTGNPAASLEATGGLYFASCNRNGILFFTAAKQAGGALVKRFDGVWNNSGALATDGNFTFAGGRKDGSNTFTIYSSNEQYLALGMGYPFGTFMPTLRHTTPAFPSWFNHLDGHLGVSRWTSTSTATRYDLYDVTRPDTSTYPLRGSVDLASSQLIDTKPVTDEDYVYVAQKTDFWPPDLYPTQVSAIDARLAASPSVAGRAQGKEDQNFLALALHRQRLYASLETPTGVEIAVYDVTNPAAMSPLTKLSPDLDGRILGDFAASGRYLAFVTATGGFSPPYELRILKLGTNRDGAGATELGTVFTSQLPLGSPTFVGDTLYVRHNLGVASFDLTPLWTGDALPVYLGSHGSAESAWRSPKAQLLIEGPWAFVLGDSYRAYDLR